MILQEQYLAFLFENYYTFFFPEEMRQKRLPAGPFFWPSHEGLPDTRPNVVPFFFPDRNPVNGAFFSLLSNSLLFLFLHCRELILARLLWLRPFLFQCRDELRALSSPADGKIFFPHFLLSFGSSPFLDLFPVFPPFF